MSKAESRIREAADELARALSEGGGDYIVHAERYDVTRIDDDGQKFAYTIYVVEHSERRLAP